MKNSLRIAIALLGSLVWVFFIVPAITSDQTASFLLGMPAGAIAVFYVLAGWK